MDVPKSTFGLLRRKLEEILTLLSDRASEQPRPEHQPGSLSSQLEPEPDRASECVASKPEAHQPGEHDELFEDALEVITEFGDASPAILQMWLSIDHGRALIILGQLEAEGMISPKGKVLHKAFERFKQG